MTSWDVMWLIVIGFVFVAYLMILFNIIGDLFRDHEPVGLGQGGVDGRPDLLPDPDGGRVPRCPG